jgi:hypothetical protein
MHNHAIKSGLFITLFVTLLYDFDASNGTNIQDGKGIEYGFLIDVCVNATNMN